ALRLRTRPSGLRTFEATFAFTVVTARCVVAFPKETLSIGFRVLVSRHPAIQTTGLLTLARAGLSPAEHASLRWTHNRTCRFPASGSRPLAPPHSNASDREEALQRALDRVDRNRRSRPPAKSAGQSPRRHQSLPPGNGGAQSRPLGGIRSHRHLPEPHSTVTDFARLRG